MEQPPREDNIRAWLLEHNPLGLFRHNAEIVITDIDPKPWSGHFNFLISAGGQKMVLRFKGPEWGTPSGVSEEYTILKKVEPFAVGPKVFFHTKDFFGEPMLLMEYLSGSLATELSVEEKTEDFWERVAKFVAHINEIPFSEHSFPFREPMTDYKKHKKAWTERTREIVEYSATKRFGKEIEELLPALFARLDDCTPLLQRVMQKQGPSFIFESAHAGHLMKVPEGFRFLNWEQVSFGDPSFMLAVFLISVQGEEDFPRIREMLVHSYLNERPIGDFEKLLEQRLWERAVSNALYSLWTAVRYDKILKKPTSALIDGEATVHSLKNLV